MVQSTLCIKQIRAGFSVSGSGSIRTNGRETNRKKSSIFLCIDSDVKSFTHSDRRYINIYIDTYMYTS